MDNLQLKRVPAAKTGMLIRRPVAEVFEAFVNPEITTKFWFTKSSGRLEAGKQVQWDWEMYGISVPVTVRSIDPNTRILIEWVGRGSPTTVEWIFTSREDGTTFVSITNAGFTGDGDQLVEQATDSGWFDLHRNRMHRDGERRPSQQRSSLAQDWQQLPHRASRPRCWLH